MIKRKRKINKRRIVEGSRLFTVIGNGDGDPYIQHYLAIGDSVSIHKDYGWYARVYCKQKRLFQHVDKRHLK